MQEMRTDEPYEAKCQCRSAPRHNSTLSRRAGEILFSYFFGQLINWKAPPNQLRLSICAGNKELVFRFSCGDAPCSDLGNASLSFPNPSPRNSFGARLILGWMNGNQCSVSVGIWGSGFDTVIDTRTRGFHESFAGESLLKSCRTRSLYSKVR